MYMLPLSPIRQVLAWGTAAEVVQMRSHHRIEAFFKIRILITVVKTDIN